MPESGQSVPLEIACNSCRAVLYSGYELKPPKEVIRANDNKCKTCGASLSNVDFIIEVSRASLG